MAVTIRSVDGLQVVGVNFTPDHLPTVTFVLTSKGEPVAERKVRAQFGEKTLNAMTALTNCIEADLADLFEGRPTQTIVQNYQFPEEK